MDKISKIRKYKEAMLFFTRDERIEEKVLPVKVLTIEAVKFSDYCATTINKII